MQFDPKNRVVRVGVRDLLGKETARWDVPFMPGRAELGRDMHSHRRRLREESLPGYQGEVHLSHTFVHRGYTVILQGRIDGLYPSEEGLIVEEFKSVALEDHELRSLSPFDMPSARLQLGIYLYVLHLQGHQNLIGELVVCSIFDRTDDQAREWVLRLEPFHAEVHQTIEDRLDEWLDAFEARMRWFAARQAAAETLPFPHPTLRQVQGEMLTEIKTCFEKGVPLLLEAPTGIGKTAVSLFAAIQYAYQHNLKIFYVTAKTSGQQGALETLKRMQARGAPVRGLVLTARDKICPQPVVYCHPDFCPYAKEYVERRSRSQILAELAVKGLLGREDFADAGAILQLCPFELSLDMLEHVDVVICDYNYVFGPGATLRRIFMEQSYDHYLLVIDEAHNLVARSRDYYSPLLSWRATRMLESWGEQRLDALGARIRQLAVDIQQYFWQEMEASGLTEVEEGAVECVPDVSLLRAWRDTLELMLLDDPLRRRYLPSPGEEDLLLAYYRQLSNFTEVAEALDHTSTALIERKGEEACLRILCHDASRHLRKRLEGFYGTLAMSATFSPPEFYQQLLGFEAESVVSAYPSPFPPENRGVFIVADFPDRFQERPKAIPRLRGIVEQVLEAHPGNYALYVPSFEFMRTLQPLLELPDYELLVQDPRMDDALRAALLRRLSMPLQARGHFRGFKGRLLMAVQGGSFAEGIEWPEGVLSGVIIVSPGLPRKDVDQELHRRYFEENMGRGFEYTYLYPGMSKVVQAAGRLIRRSEDRGVIVLVGKRFVERQYSTLLPRYWYEQSVMERVTEDLGESLRTFWAGHERSET